MEALTNLDLEDYAKQLKLPLIDVCSKDQLPPFKVGSYYINMQNSTDGDGSHWVLLKIFDDQHALYFDSFGIYPPKPITDRIKNVPFSNREIQDIHSNACGYFVLACDKYMTPLHKPILEQFDDFLNIFRDPKQNDKILGDYLKSNGIV